MNEIRVKISSQCAMLMMCTCLSFSVAAQTVELRSDVYVKGPKVLLGDIAILHGDDTAALAEVEISRAALPGGLKRLNAGLIETRIRSAGFNTEGLEFKGAARVTANTLHLNISGEMMTEDLRAYIRSEMPWSLEDAVIDIPSAKNSFILPEGDVEFRWYSDPQYDYLGRGSFRCEVTVDGQVKKSLSFVADIKAFAEVVTAAVDIQRGDYVGNASLQLERKELSSNGPRVFTSLSAARGLVAKSSITRGTVLNDRKLRLPILVKRNQDVAVETIIGSIRIRARAKVMEDGAAGDNVRCMNLQSKEIFFGVVGKDGTVIVR